MTAPVITVDVDTPFQEALRLMQERKFRRLPVVDGAGKLVGIVSERDLLHAAPSQATSLSVWEVNYLLWKLRVADVMTERVVTVTPELPIEDAAQIMVTSKIGGLPVVDSSGNLVGMITETDVFKAFTEMLAGGEHGLRLLVRVPEGKGVLASVSSAIYELGGNILSVGTFHDRSEQTRMLAVKVAGVDKDVLSAKLASIGDEVVDARTV
jgi:acetoin utilization protein AcuB